MNPKNIYLPALVGVLLLVSSSLASAIEGVECNPNRGICISTDSGVPFRVLTKPAVNLYSEKNENSTIIEREIVALQAYFVNEMTEVAFDRTTMESTGWYYVSPSLGAPSIGYLRAEDVVPWRQALAVAFTNPGASERRPVIMYESLRTLESSLAEIDSQTITGDQLHANIDAGNPAEGIITRERNTWTDIDESFYLMPIIEHDDLSVYYPADDMRALRVTVLTDEAATDQAKACDVSSNDFDQCQEDAAQASSGGFSGLGIDVVFVVDMTASMGPYIDDVRRSIRQVARRLGERPDAGSIRFGLVGYRDSIEANPELEWTAKVFTPDLIESGEFDSLLSSETQVAEANVSSGDFSEEVFAGMKAAVTEVNWRPEAARMIILIGDASGHDAIHIKSTTGLDEKAIRDLTDSEDIYTAAIYVGQQTEDLVVARPQYETMAAGDEGNKAFFEAISDSSGETGLEESLKASIEQLLEFVRSGDFSAIQSGSGRATDAILAAARAAFVDYLGTGASPPPSVTAWALDRDISAFDKRALKVKVLVSRTDIENLIDFLDGLLTQLDTQQVSGSSFFGSAQQGATATTYDLSLAQGEQLSQAGALPGAISNLPYKSEVLTLTLDEFKNVSVDERTRIEERLRSLVKYYEASLSNTDAWVSLNSSGSVQDRVFLMDLEWLP